MKRNPRALACGALILASALVGAALGTGDQRPKPTGALAAHLFRRAAVSDERGLIPAGAWLRAAADRERNLRHWRLDRRPSEAAGLPGAWQSKGPYNVGGRTRSILTDPRDPKKLWAGSVGGGIFTSSNGGQSWSPMNDFFPVLAIGAMARASADPNTVYVGTGEGLFNSDALRGAGVFKSTDDGASWTQLAATAGWAPVNRLAVSAADPAIVLAATGGGLYRSTNGGEAWTRVVAYRSTDVVFNPQNGDELVAHQHGPGNLQKVIRSTDGGATWSESTGIEELDDWLARIDVAYAPSNPAIVYANQNGAFYRSSDGGQSFDRVGTSGQGSWYNNVIWVHPKNADFVAVGGYALVKSTDGGRNFKPLSNGYLLTEQVHPDVHEIVADAGFNGTTNQRVWVGSDGGIHTTDKILTASPRLGWKSAVAGYTTTQYYNAAGDGPSQLLLGGTQDNGTLRLQKVQKATLTFGGDGASVAVDPDNGKYVYGEYIGHNNVFRSADGGKTIQFIDQNLPERGQGNFIAPFILDPNNGNRMLLGAKQLWVSDNVRVSKPPGWRSIKPETPLRVENINAIAVAKGDANVIWVGHNDGRVFMTTEGTSATPAWTPIDDNASRNPLPRLFPHRIVIGWQDSSVVYIAFGSWNGDALWKTTDAGATWRPATGSGESALPRAPIRGLAQHPGNPDWIYAGTEVGVFASEDGGATWAAVNEGPANVSVDDLRFLRNSHTLLAGTHGRGLWTVALP